MPDDELRDIKDNVEDAQDKLDSGDHEGAQASLDAALERIGALEAAVSSHGQRLDDLAPLSELARDLKEMEAQEQGPEAKHRRYRRIFGAEE